MIGWARTTDGEYLQVSADRFSPHDGLSEDGVTVQFQLADGSDGGNRGHTMSTGEARQFAAAVLDGADLAEGMGLALIVMPQPPRWHEQRGL